MAQQNLEIGRWDFPVLPAAEATITEQNVQTFCSRPLSVVRSPPRQIVDPALRGLAKSVSVAASVAIEPQRILFLKNTKLFGQRLFESRGQIFTDFELDEFYLSKYLNNSFDTHTRESGLYERDGQIFSHKLDMAPLEIDGHVVIATSSEPINYGAWLIRVLPKVFYAKSVLPEDSFKFLIYCEREWQRNLLEFCGLSPKQIIAQDFSKTYKIESAIIPSWPSRWKYLDAFTKGIFQILIAKAYSLRPKHRSPKAIYVTRSKHSSASKNVRPFAQELEFERKLQSLGVTPFAPETVDFPEAILTFNDADLVIGPQGAGMFNCVFCKPGTVVIDIEHLPYFLPGHCNLFDSCGLDYSLIIGNSESAAESNTIHTPLTIDVDKTLEYISTISKQVFAEASSNDC